MKTNTPKQTVEAMRKKIEAVVRQLYLSGDHFEEEEVAVKKATDKILALLNPVEKKEKCSCSCHLKIGASVKELKKVKGNSCRHCVMLVSSPNEAPKGEHATLKNPCYCECHTEGDEEECPKCKFAKAPKGEACECDCHKVVESMNKKRQGWESNCGFCGHRSKPQPPAPDKEWEPSENSIHHPDNIEIKKTLEKLEAEFDDHYPVCEHSQCVFTADTMVKILKEHDKALLLSKDQEADRRIEEVIGEIEKNIIKEAHTRNIKVGTSIFGFYYAIRSDIEALKKKLSPQKGGKGGK